MAIEPAWLAHVLAVQKGDSGELARALEMASRAWAAGDGNTTQKWLLHAAGLAHEAGRGERAEAVGAAARIIGEPSACRHRGVETRPYSLSGADSPAQLVVQNPARKDDAEWVSPADDPAIPDFSDDSTSEQTRVAPVESATAPSGSVPALEPMRAQLVAVRFDGAEASVVFLDDQARSAQDAQLALLIPLSSVGLRG